MKTQAALAAKQIKAELKKEFPLIKFSVNSQNYAGGDSVHISWQDGPTDKAVSEITKKYQYGHFDGMTDCYEYSNSREDINQAKYVRTSRKVSAEVKAKMKTEIAKKYGIVNENDESEWMSKFNMWSDQKVWRELS